MGVERGRETYNWIRRVDLHDERLITTSIAWYVAGEKRIGCGLAGCVEGRGYD